MIVGNINELKVVSILDRGVPNKECIAIQANDAVNMGQYGIMLGQYATDGTATPYFDHMFWFGDGVIKSGDWLFVFTGSGAPRTTKAVNGMNDIFSVFWGKPTTVFADSLIVPMLFRVDAVDVLTPPANLPQIGQP